MKFPFFIAFLFLLSNLFSQSSVFTPLNNIEKYADEIETLRSFQKYKRDLDNLLDERKYLEASKLVSKNKSKFPQIFTIQISTSLMEINLSLNKKNEIKKIINFYVQKTLWKINTVESSLLPPKFKKLKGYEYAKTYLNKNYEKIINKELNKSKSLLNKLFWLNAINQRDQDYRRHITFDIISNEDCANETLNYFDSVNVESIKLYLSEYGYPKFIAGARYINLAIIHYNKQSILNLKEFNLFSKLIWSSVTQGITSLSDYCYIIDRFLVINQKEPELFGFYNSSSSNCSYCYSNCKKIGLVE